MNAMNYKGHSARVEYGADDRIFFGKRAGINDVVRFHAENGNDLEDAFREGVDDYLETCAKVGKTPERPNSGKMMFRVPPEVHASTALAAQLTSKSLNQRAEEALRNAAGPLSVRRDRARPSATNIPVKRVPGKAKASRSSLDKLLSKQPS